MKKRNFLLALLAVSAVAVSVSLTSCKDDETTTVNPTPTEQLEMLPTDVKGKVSLDASKTYLLAGPCYVKPGAELTIPAGTVIKAKPGFGTYMIVEAGGKIFINGTAEKPVKMYSAAATPKSGDWGGLLINGKAPLAGGEEGSTEINSNLPYGGTDVKDNSGVIKYLILEHMGASLNKDVEHNGLTLNGVGNGTIIENVMIANCADDAIEWFGGTVNVTNLLVVNSGDDMFDMTQGYAGTLKNAYGIWENKFLHNSSDPCGIEADGNLDGLSPSFPGQSNFKVDNITFDIRIDYVANEPAKRMQQVLRLRRGNNCVITNALAKGTGRAEYLVNLTDGKGNADTKTAVSITNGLKTAPDKGIIKYPEGMTEADYKDVKVVANNKGCETSNFAWTKYKF